MSLGGKVLEGRFELQELVGSGTSGEVYRARDLSTGAIAAVKLFQVESQVIPQSRERFAQEAELLTRIVSPYVIRVLHAGEVGPVLYYAMEYLEGLDLTRWLKTNGVPDARTSTKIMRDVSRGLLAIHEQGIVHRDLKPDNVIIDSGGVPRIADFGLARTIHGGSIRTNTGMLLGTPGFMAPEVLKGEKALPASDVYALGILAFFIACGRSPFRSTNMAEILQEQIRGLEHHSFGFLPLELVKLVQRMTLVEPEHRPEAAEVVRILEAEAAREKTGPSPSSSSSTRALSPVSSSGSGEDIDRPTRTFEEDILQAVIDRPSEVDGIKVGGGVAPHPAGGRPRWLAVPALLLVAVVAGMLLGDGGGGPAPSPTSDTPTEVASELGRALEQLEDFRLSSFINEAYVNCVPDRLDQTARDARNHWRPDVRRGIQMQIRESDWAEALATLRSRVRRETWREAPSEPEARRAWLEERRRLLVQLNQLRLLNAFDLGMGGDGTLVPHANEVSATAVTARLVLDPPGRGDMYPGARPLFQLCAYMTNHPNDPRLIGSVLNGALILGAESQKYCVGSDYSRFYAEHEVRLPLELPATEAGDVTLVLGVFELTPFAYFELVFMGPGGDSLMETIIHVPKLDRPYRAEIGTMQDWEAGRVLLSLPAALIGGATRVRIIYRDLLEAEDPDFAHWAMVAGVGYLTVQE